MLLYLRPLTFFLHEIEINISCCYWFAVLEILIFDYQDAVLHGVFEFFFTHKCFLIQFHLPLGFDCSTILKHLPTSGHTFQPHVLFLIHWLNLTCIN